MVIWMCIVVWRIIMHIWVQLPGRIGRKWGVSIMSWWVVDYLVLLKGCMGMFIWFVVPMWMVLRHVITVAFGPCFSRLLSLDAPI
jgi:hypothetical protein